MLPIYKSLIDRREVLFINHYITPNLKHPTEDQIDELIVESHVWTRGDKFFKLAFDYYSDSELWWVIAWFNKTPTEAHLQVGDVVHIPLPLDTILRFYDI